MKKGDLSVLEALSRGESVGESRISQQLLGRLRDEHLLIASSHGSKVSYRAVDPGAISLPGGELLSGSASRTLAGWPEEMSRSEQVALFGDSKVFRARACPGFPVNSYEPVSAALGGKPLVIDPAPGSFLFISDWRSFEIPPDVVVVGVENMENFRLARSQKYLFEHLCSPVLFVSRYPQSTDLVSWLGSIPNRYLHFGDLDLAGIHIFLTEFQRHLGPRAEFFIPPDADARLQFLISLIHKHHRGYDQEGYCTLRESLASCTKI